MSHLAEGGLEVQLCRSTREAGCAVHKVGVQTELVPASVCMCRAGRLRREMVPTSFCSWRSLLKIPPPLIPVLIIINKSPL